MVSTHGARILYLQRGGGEPMTDRVAHIVSGGVRKAALKQVRAHAVG